MADRIKELREKQAKITAEARERLDQINTNTDEARSAELHASHDTAMADYDKLEGQIKREEKLLAMENQAEELRTRQRPLQPNSNTRGHDEGVTADYRSAFYSMLAAGGDVSELSSELRSILRSGVVKPEERAQSTVAAGGGYTVPTELAGFIVQSMKAWGPMFDEAICTDMLTSGGGAINIPTVDDTSKTAGAHTEGTALADTGAKDVVFGNKTLNAYVFDTEFIKFSFELAQDSAFNVEQLLGSLLGERLGRMANTQLTIGTGTNAPNGIVTASTLGVTAATATGITWDDIIDLEHSVDPAYRVSPKARYMFNDTTLKAVRKLKDGDGNYLWQSGDVQKGIPASFNGRSYSINQAMASLAAAQKVMLFGDFSKYFVRKVGSPSIGVMRERFWPDLGIAGLIRFDGELGDTAAVKHLITAAV